MDSCYETIEHALKSLISKQHIKAQLKMRLKDATMQSTSGRLGK